MTTAGPRVRLMWNEAEPKLRMVRKGVPGRGAGNQVPGSAEQGRETWGGVAQRSKEMMAPWHLERGKWKLSLPAVHIAPGRREPCLRALGH